MHRRRHLRRPPRGRSRTPIRLRTGPIRSAISYATKISAKDSRLVLAAQEALQKIGYAVKIDGVEGAATQQALRDFESAHGLSLTTEITPRLVKQLASAARGAEH